jgi:Flp pilus assembly protein TadB
MFVAEDTGDGGLGIAPLLTLAVFLIAMAVIFVMLRRETRSRRHKDPPP